MFYSTSEWYKVCKFPSAPIPPSPSTMAQEAPSAILDPIVHPTGAAAPPKADPDYARDSKEVVAEYLEIHEAWVAALAMDVRRKLESKWLHYSMTLKTVLNEAEAMGGEASEHAKTIRGELERHKGELPPVTTFKDARGVFQSMGDIAAGLESLQGLMAEEPDAKRPKTEKRVREE